MWVPVREHERRLAMKRKQKQVPPFCDIMAYAAWLH